MVSQVDEEDARSLYRGQSNTVGDDDDDPGTSSLEEERKYVAWEQGDPENPYNWSKVCAVHRPGKTA